MKKIVVSLMLSAIILLVACKDDNQPAISVDPFAELNLPAELLNYANIELPSYFTASEFPAQFQFESLTEYDNTPSDNPITDAGATLGRVLFYDRKLSANGTVACASCHWLLRNTLDILGCIHG